CWSMERGRSLHLPKPLKQWVDGPRHYVRIVPPAPGLRGDTTVASVVDVSDVTDYEKRVLAWAQSAWRAWYTHWTQAQAWVEEALVEYCAGTDMQRF
ncbi:MAG: hypothetical protein WCY01_10985, partial [Alkalispirochaeta sp.]